MAKTITALASAVIAVCGVHASLSKAIEDVRKALVSAGIDVTKAGIIGNAITPILAQHYKVELIESERVSKYGTHKFPEGGAGKTAANVRKHIVDEIIGTTSAHTEAVPEFEIPSAVRAAAKALIQAQAAFVAATKGYENAGALRKQALEAVR